MLAIIEIPHQRRARFEVYNNREEIKEVACNVADTVGDEHPSDYSYACEYLRGDLHMMFVVESACDLMSVEAWVKNRNHQDLRVSVMLPALREMVAENESLIEAKP